MNHGNLADIAGKFSLPGSFQQAVAHGVGHINDTFLVAQGSPERVKYYIVQRINHQVFADPAALMENIDRITRHIAEKLLSNPPGNPLRVIFRVIPTRNGSLWYEDEAGNFWRAYDFIPNAQTVQRVQSPQQVYQAAEIYGWFQKLVMDIPAGELHESIAHFHDGPSRFRAFQRSLAADTFNRAVQATAEAEFLDRHRNIFGMLPGLVESGKIPLRITHNDTKLNNVVFDARSGEAVSVVDLDTVMPGLSLYDFGDLARSVLASAEDEPESTGGEIDLTLYRALVSGYLAATGSFLTIHEVDNLVTGIKHMTLMIGARFLTDFLDGDTYFKIHRPNHNLDRARVQFNLYRTILNSEPALAAVLEEEKSALKGG